MRRLTSWNSFALCGLLVLLLSASAAAASSPVTVGVRPAAGNYRPGDLVAVEVWVADVTGLYGADVKLAFDPTAFMVLDADPNRAGVQVTPRSDLLAADLVLRKEADNSAGTAWYVVTQLNPSEPVSGSGALFAFTAQILRPGLHLLRIQSQQLSTRDAELIAAETRDARYWVSASGEAPKSLYFTFVSTGR